MLFVCPSLAVAGTDPREQFLRSVDRMMVSLRSHNAHSSKTIKSVYRQHLDLFQLDEFDSLEEAIATGAVVPLPAEPERFNLNPRVNGRFPIGEKDMANQAAYIAARPAAVGALLEIAAQVKSGPLEVTSLVRHNEYQRSLRKTNGNAVTSIPMHTLGLAFDISLINTPLPTVYELRDVLRRMQANGEVLFIGERRQLVFHVVPHPSRLGHFADVYARALAASMPGANVIAPPAALAARAPVVADVISEVSTLRPTDDFADEWWAADEAHADLAVQVTPSPDDDEPQSPQAFPWGLVFGTIAAVGGVVMAMVRYLA